MKEHNQIVRLDTYAEPLFETFSVESSTVIMGSVQGSSTETLEEEDFVW